MKTFPIRRAHLVAPVEPENEWLIEELWGAEAVGTVGGEPKTLKSFMSLTMAVAVASGRPCLGRFHVKRSGPVLIYAAEDALPAVRKRLDGIAAGQGQALADLPLWLIDSPTVRIDIADDREALANAVATVRPALLILDPFVRLHRINENESAYVVPLLAFLCELRRRFQCAVMLVHHARKGAGSLRGGQALRGSSEIHAWADASLFLRNKGDALLLSGEHRDHKPPPELLLRLDLRPQGAVLLAQDPPPAPMDSRPPSQPNPRERILQALSACPDPVSVRALQRTCRIRTNTLCDILNLLKTEGVVTSTAAGWALASPARQHRTDPVHDSPHSTGQQGLPML